MLFNTSGCHRPECELKLSRSAANVAGTISWLATGTLTKRFAGFEDIPNHRSPQPQVWQLQESALSDPRRVTEGFACPTGHAWPSKPAGMSCVLATESLTDR